MRKAAPTSSPTSSSRSDIGEEPARGRERTLSRRDLRLASGSVLLGYVALHLANHGLGLVSVAVAERGLAFTLRVWHSLPGSLVLYGAAAIHLALAFDALYGRRTLRMAPLDLIRIVLGLGIPTLLIGHVVGTRLAWEAFHQSPQYARVVWSLWATDGQGRQLALLVPGWLHGCLGIHLAFGKRPLYRRLRWPLFAAAVLLPVLGGLGFLAMANELAADHSQRARLDAGIRLADDRTAWLLGVKEVLLGVYFGAIAAVFAARAIRTARGAQRAARARKRCCADPAATDIPETAKATGADVDSERPRNLAAPGPV